jgi:hypothetical protein
MHTHVHIYIYIISRRLEEQEQAFRAQCKAQRAELTQKIANFENEGGLPEEEMERLTKVCACVCMYVCLYVCVCMYTAYRKKRHGAPSPRCGCEYVCVHVFVCMYICIHSGLPGEERSASQRWECACVSCLYVQCVSTHASSTLASSTLASSTLASSTLASSTLASSTEQLFSRFAVRVFGFIHAC